MSLRTSASLCLLCAALAPGQKPARLTFEVASVRPSKPGEPGGGIKALPAGQGYTAQNVPVKLMIALMYKLPARQIQGGPGWLNTDLYNVEARADHAYNLDDLHTMFQNLLADEFGLKFHRETKEGAVYALTVDKSGLKMRINESPQDFNVPVVGPNNGVAVGRRVGMEYLCWWLGTLVLFRDERPVIDKSGLKGNYDFDLTFAPELGPGVPNDDFKDRLPIFEALRQQLGLELKPQKGTVEVFVIDHVERPAAN
jgi:uncharacterized protein (TIGR03435 family)